jgi:hypothetical protein
MAEPSATVPVQVAIPYDKCPRCFQETRHDCSNVVLRATRCSEFTITAESITGTYECPVHLTWTTKYTPDELAQYGVATLTP